MARTTEHAGVASPVLRAHSNGPKTVHAVLHTVRHRRWVMMMSVLPARRRAAEARSMLLVDHMPRPVAAVQQSTMPGACQELGSITWPHTARVSARALCSPTSVARRRKL